MRSILNALAAYLLLLPGNLLAQQAIERGPSAPVSGANPLSAQDRKEVVENIEAASAARYVDPAGGKRLASYLRAQLAKGAYDALADPVDFAATLTKDLRTAVNDVHLRAVYEPNRAASTLVVRGLPNAGLAQAGPRSFARIDQRSEQQIARTNFGFDAVQRLDGNIGYLKISRFVPLAMSSKTAAAAMDFLANSDALIVDLRGDMGGSPDLVQLILSYFTPAEPTELIAHYVREGDRTERMMSLAKVPGERLTGKPLYVLIDSDTGSAAESFAYIAQRKKLGVVIGQTSAGAGNGGNMLPVGSGISLFLPFARVIDGPGWEQIGVKPDMDVDPEQALVIAHKAALRQLIAAAKDPVALREREWALELLTANDRATVPMRLSDYEGQFGTRGFKAVGGKLLVMPSSGAAAPLTCTGPETFRLDNARYTFERDAAGQVTAVKVETLSGTTTHAVKSI